MSNPELEKLAADIAKRVEENWQQTDAGQDGELKEQSAVSLSATEKQQLAQLQSKFINDYVSVNEGSTRNDAVKTFNQEFNTLVDTAIEETFAAAGNNAALDQVGITFDLPDLNPPVPGFDEHTRDQKIQNALNNGLTLTTYDVLEFDEKGNTNLTIRTAQDLVIENPEYYAKLLNTDVSNAATDKTYAAGKALQSYLDARPNITDVSNPNFDFQNEFVQTLNSQLTDHFLNIKSDSYIVGNANRGVAGSKLNDNGVKLEHRSRSLNDVANAVQDHENGAEIINKLFSDKLDVREVGVSPKALNDTADRRDVLLGNLDNLSAAEVREQIKGSMLNMSYYVGRTGVDLIISGALNNPELLDQPFNQAWDQLNPSTEGKDGVIARAYLKKEVVFDRITEDFAEADPNKMTLRTFLRETIARDMPEYNNVPDIVADRTIAPEKPPEKEIDIEHKDPQQKPGVTAGAYFSKTNDLESLTPNGPTNRETIEGGLALNVPIFNNDKHALNAHGRFGFKNIGNQSNTFSSEVLNTGYRFSEELPAETLTLDGTMQRGINSKNLEAGAGFDFTFKKSLLTTSVDASILMGDSSGYNFDIGLTKGFEGGGSIGIAGGHSEYEHAINNTMNISGGGELTHKTSEELTNEINVRDYELFETTREEEFTNTREVEFEDTRIVEFEDTREVEFEDTRIVEFEDTREVEFEDTREIKVPRYRPAYEQEEIAIYDCGVQTGSAIVNVLDDDDNPIPRVDDDGNPIYETGPDGQPIIDGYDTISESFTNTRTETFTNTREECFTNTRTETFTNTREESFTNTRTEEFTDTRSVSAIGADETNTLHTTTGSRDTEKTVSLTPSTLNYNANSTLNEENTRFMLGGTTKGGLGLYGKVDFGKQSIGSVVYDGTGDVSVSETTVTQNAATKGDNVDSVLEYDADGYIIGEIQGLGADGFIPGTTETSTTERTDEIGFDGALSGKSSSKAYTFGAGQYFKGSDFVLGAEYTNKSITTEFNYVGGNGTALGFEPGSNFNNTYKNSFHDDKVGIFANKQWGNVSVSAKAALGLQSKEVDVGGTVAVNLGGGQSKELKKLEEMKKTDAKLDAEKANGKTPEEKRQEALESKSEFKDMKKATDSINIKTPEAPNLEQKAP